MAITPDGKTALFTDASGAEQGLPGTISTIDVKTRTKDPTDIPVGEGPVMVAITPCRQVTG